MISKKFWSNRRVLVTGHSGFKGSWLVTWLHSLSAKITGISLPPETEPNLFSLTGIEQLCESHFCDIRDEKKLSSLIKLIKPEIVFHLAAQPLVRASYQNPVETFSTNMMGTVHVLNAIRGLDSVRVVLMITTDKVYRNNEWFWPYREDDALGGHDPYSSSKAACELAISSYRDAFLSDQGVAVASARAGNVIGGGDWSEDRLIPDAVRAWQAGDTLEIRQPDAIRPWQHVLEPSLGYLILAQNLWYQPKLQGAFNFGPETNEAATVREVIKLAHTVYAKGKVNFNETQKGPHEAGLLALETSKVRNLLGVKPKLTLNQSVHQTMCWYREQYEGVDAHELCKMQITEYETLL